MSLKDFKPGNESFLEDEKFLKQSDSKMPASTYHEETNALKIDKLSNRVTIISIILPCLIGAIIAFAYFDMKERMDDVDLTKQNQVKAIFNQLEEKLNALDVKIAKNKFDLDNKLTELNKKRVSLEGQIAKLASTENDAKNIENKLNGLEKQLAGNSKKDQAFVKAMEKNNQQILSSIKKNQSQFNSNTRQIKDKIKSFKENFDAKLQQLSDQDFEVGKLRKDLSLLDKKYKALDNRTDTLTTQLTSRISQLEEYIDKLLKSSLPSSKQEPKTDMDSSDSVEIKEEPLTQ